VAAARSAGGGKLEEEKEEQEAVVASSRGAGGRLGGLELARALLPLGLGLLGRAVLSSAPAAELEVLPPAPEIPSGLLDQGSQRTGTK
jgi:hypothetical protein